MPNEKKQESKMVVVQITNQTFIILQHFFVPCFNLILSYYNIAKKKYEKDSSKGKS